MGKSLRSSLFGILILMIGLLMGILLVDQTQSFKNKAKENMEKIYTVCHKTGDDRKPWEQIEATAQELPAYLNAGDIFGECPEELMFNE
jgi:hypothetical protein